MKRILFEPDKLAACPNEHDKVVCETDLQEFVLRQTGKRNTSDPVCSKYFH